MVTMGKRLGWNCGNVALAIACLWLGRGAALAVTTNDVTWSGGAGAGNPYWNVDANWLGGVAPTNPTKATVFFATNGQTVAGTLDADRTVGGISAGSSTNTTHTLNLGGYTLTVTNSLTILSGTKALYNTLYLTNGTVRIGTDTAAGAINVNPPGNLCLSGATLDAHNLSRIYVYPNPYALSQIDLRGATILGGTLRMGSLLLDGSGWYGSLMLLNNATVVSSIIVTQTLEMGVADVSQNTPQYIGNPADTFTFDTATFGRFPAGISLTVGTSATARATMLLAKPTMGTAINRVAIRAAPGGGGTFTAYLSSLGIGIRGIASGTISPRGLFDVAAMDSCLLDVVNLQLAPGQTNAVAADNEIGELDLPTGTATVGTAVIGATAGVGYGKLSLSNTMFTVTNSLTLNATASNSISVGAVSKGLDVQGTFIDGGGKIRVNFLTDPAVGTTNWAIRIAGNAQSTLGAMVGSGRLTSTNAFVDAAKKAGFIYDASANYSYYALVDTNVTLLPLAIAKSQVTYEMAPDGQVLVAVSEINNGSFDPNNRATTLTISTNGGPDSTSLTFNTVGDYAVTLKIVAGTDSATAGSTVHVISPNPGVTNALTWSGAASTVLMNRPEWM